MLSVVDEPALRNLLPRELARAVALVQASPPGVRRMIVGAAIRPYDRLPPGITYWGFDRYFLRDPASDAALTATMDRAAVSLGPDQAMMLVVEPPTSTPLGRQAPAKTTWQRWHGPVTRWPRRAAILSAFRAIAGSAASTLPPKRVCATGPNPSALRIVRSGG